MSAGIFPRPVITFDIDGVVCDGGYLPPEQRCWQRYNEVKVLDAAMVIGINRLTEIADIYFVSSRDHVNANYFTRYWLENQGFWMEHISVLTGIASADKPIILRLIKSEAHFDDDPTCVGGYRAAWLVDNPGWKYNQEAQSRFTDRIVRGWNEIAAKIDEVTALSRQGVLSFHVPKQELTAMEVAA